MGKTDSSDKPKYTVKSPREVDRKTYSEDARRRMREGGRKGGKARASVAKLKEWWMKSFIKQNPLKEGEVYIRWTNKKTGWRHAAKADDSQRVEYSRDGITWKIAKKVNPHAKVDEDPPRTGADNTIEEAT